MTTDEKTLDRKERLAARARWSYVILAAFTVLCVMLLAAFMIKYVNDNNHAWCDIIRASLPTSPPKRPADNAPATQWKQYHNYYLVVQLGRRFGCIP